MRMPGGIRFSLLILGCASQKYQGGLEMGLSRNERQIADIASAVVAAIVFFTALALVSG